MFFGREYFRIFPPNKASSIPFPFPSYDYFIYNSVDIIEIFIPNDRNNRADSDTSLIVNTLNWKSGTRNA